MKDLLLSLGTIVVAIGVYCGTVILVPKVVEAIGNRRK